MYTPCIMSIATSDSGGGAGIQADLKTIMALGGFGTTTIVALTAQNGLEVAGIHAIDTDFIRLQLRTLFNGFTIRAAKTGMLFSHEIIDTVADELRVRDFPLVVDPVAVSQTGHKLLQDDAVHSLVHTLIPMADLVTPNRPEAEMLAGVPIEKADDIPRAARHILALGVKAVLIKGGHFPEHDALVDWLCLPNALPLALPQKRVDTNNNHGTGCTLSAAIATHLAHGYDLREAVVRSQAYLNTCLRESYTPGKGYGPPNHLAGAVR